MSELIAGGSMDPAANVPHSVNSERSSPKTRHLRPGGAIGSTKFSVSQEELIAGGSMDSAANEASASAEKAAAQATGISGPPVDPNHRTALSEQKQASNRSSSPTSDLEDKSKRFQELRKAIKKLYTQKNVSRSCTKKGI